MSNSNSTKDYPVKYFKEFFLEGGLKKYRDNFLDYANREKKKSPKDVEVIPHEIEIVLVTPTTNIIGEPTSETELFTDHLFQDLKNEVEISKNLLRDAIVEKYENIDVFINTQRIIIRDIIEVNSQLLASLPRCKDILKELDNYIAELTSEVEKPEKAIQQRRRRPDIHKTYNEDEVIKYSFFAGQDISSKFLKELHTLLCEHGIIEELEDTDEGERQFIQIFSSENPRESEFSVRFTKDNHEVVFIFIELKSYLKDLTAINIEKSQCFLNKKGKVFNSNDFNVAKNKLKNPAIKIDKVVRNFIEALRKKFPIS